MAKKEVKPVKKVEPKEKVPGDFCDWVEYEEYLASKE